MATYRQLYSDLVGYVPKLPVQLAQTLVQQAWKDIRDARFWSFLIGQTFLNSPGIITAGTASVTQYSNLVTLDATASAAVTNLSNPVITLRQFRQSGGAVFSIIGFDDTIPNAIVLTLDSNYQDTTNPTASYQIYQCYYYPPSSDFKRWESIVQPDNAYQFVDVNWTRKEIDRSDPQRASQGLPYYMASYKMITVGNDDYVPSFEMWPHPTSALGYFAIYQKAGLDFASNSDILPPQVSRETLSYRARYLAYEWAEANKGLHQELQATNWLALRSSVDRDYAESLATDEKNDEETFLQNWVTLNYGGPPWPVDANWMQSHAWPNA